MEELKKLVKQLEESASPDECVNLLQKMGERLINVYVIQIGKVTIDPILVEAYYYDEKFKDSSVHAVYSNSDAPTYKLARERQENNYGELYVHFGRKDGIDIVLSNGHYYLSFLIKNAFVNNDVNNNEGRETQSSISEMICINCDACSKCEKGNKCVHYGSNVLKRVSSKNRKIVFIPRKGVSGEFSKKRIAAFSIDSAIEELNNNRLLTLIKGHGKQWLYAMYALYFEENEIEARKAANKMNGSRIQNCYWELAKEDFEENKKCSIFLPD